MTASQPAFRKSTFSFALSNCVEVARDGGVILVRHSKHPHPALVYTPDEWAAFLAGVKNGEFDDLAAGQ